MKKFIMNLQRIKQINSSVTSINIISLQQFLKQHGIATLPDEFINFLHIYNIIDYNGGSICGISTQENMHDISTLNILIKHPLHKHLVFLGYDEFDYLAYNQKHGVYQIIDKDDFEVLEEYTDFASAAQHILKIEYE